MSNPLIQRALEKFDEKFPWRIYGIAGEPKSEFIEAKNKPEEIRSFLSDTVNEVMAEMGKEVEKRRLTTSNKGYDGNDLGSASDFYGIAAENWSEIIRFEDGYNAALSDIKDVLTPPTGGDKHEIG